MFATSIPPGIFACGDTEDLASALSRRRFAACLDEAAGALCRAAGVPASLREFDLLPGQALYLVEGALCTTYWYKGPHEQAAAERQAMLERQREQERADGAARLQRQDAARPIRGDWRIGGHRD
jgi:hypothetical protein